MHRKLTIKPDKTLELKLRPNERGRTDATRKRLRIDLDGFCDTQGAYLIRFKTKHISRLVGEATTLKIGETTDGFLRRFTNYNHQDWLTCLNLPLSQALDGSKQITNAYLMCLLPRLLEQDRIFVDFFFASEEYTPNELQHKLLNIYLDKHLEAPPLNLGKR